MDINTQASEMIENLAAAYGSISQINENIIRDAIKGKIKSGLPANDANKLLVQAIKLYLSYWEEEEETSITISLNARSSVKQLLLRLETLSKENQFKVIEGLEELARAIAKAKIIFNNTTQFTQWESIAQITRKIANTVAEQKIH